MGESAVAFAAVMRTQIDDLKDNAETQRGAEDRGEMAFSIGAALDAELSDTSSHRVEWASFYLNPAVSETAATVSGPSGRGLCGRGGSRRIVFLRRGIRRSERLASSRSGGWGA